MFVRLRLVPTDGVEGSEGSLGQWEERWPIDEVKLDMLARRGEKHALGTCSSYKFVGKLGRRNFDHVLTIAKHVTERAPDVQ